MVLFCLVSYAVWNLWATSADRFIVGIIPLLVVATIEMLTTLSHKEDRKPWISVVFGLALGIQVIMLAANFVVMDVVRHGLIPGLRDEFSHAGGERPASFSAPPPL